MPSASAVGFPAAVDSAGHVLRGLSVSEGDIVDVALESPGRARAVVPDVDAHDPLAGGHGTDAGGHVIPLVKLQMPALTLRRERISRPVCGSQIAKSTTVAEYQVDGHAAAVVAVDRGYQLGTCGIDPVGECGGPVHDHGGIAEVEYLQIGVVLGLALGIT